jgi:hypothetical protein
MINAYAYVLVPCLAALALLPGTGCVVTHACTEEALFSVDVTVVDSAGAPVTDATLKYSVDGGSESDCSHVFQTDNSYSCGVEQAGHFVITATRGAVTQTAAVDVTEGECHVVPVSKTITLP